MNQVHDESSRSLSVQELSPPESLLGRLVSIRVCSLTFFVLALVLTTASVVTVLVVYSADAITGLKQASTRTMTQMSGSTSAIAANLSAHTLTVLERTVQSSGQALLAASQTSQDQVTAMSTELLGRGLSQFVGSVVEYLGSIQSSMKATNAYLATMGVNLNDFSQLLNLAPELFTSLRFERATSITLTGATMVSMTPYDPFQFG
eukprot:RCo023819